MQGGEKLSPNQLRPFDFTEWPLERLIDRFSYLCEHAELIKPQGGRLDEIEREVEHLLFEFKRRDLSILENDHELAA